MAAKHGLGRGLSSLIPQNKNRATSSGSARQTERVQIEQQRKTSIKSSPISISEEKANPSASHITRDVPLEDHRTKAVTPSAHKAHVNPPQEKTLQKKEEISTIKKDESSSSNDEAVAQKGLAVVGLSTAEIAANEQQPRRYFDDAKLAELSASIKEHGIMQPLVVVRKGSGYELIAGERRLRAARMAGLTKVPAIIRGDMDDQKKLELAIIENVQRHDLNVVEEGKSYKKLIDEFHLTQEEVAKKMGKSRSAVANRVRLAGLPVEIQRALIDGTITEGHAKVILSPEGDEKRRALFEIIVSSRLSVRDAEKALGSARAGRKVSAHIRGAKSPQERLLEDQLGTYFGTKVSVASKTKGGSITLTYFSKDELAGILEKLKL